VALGPFSLYNYGDKKLGGGSISQAPMKRFWVRSAQLEIYLILFYLVTRMSEEQSNGSFCPETSV
jgi:hypothetical protein